jgi:hypothetical protein
MDGDGGVEQRLNALVAQNPGEVVCSRRLVTCSMIQPVEVRAALVSRGWRP